MEFEKLMGLIVLAWLLGSVFLMARMIRRARKLVSLLEARYPEFYAAAGRPRPGFLHSLRRNRFSQFIARREYENIGDPSLAARFEQYRKAEGRLLVYVLASLVLVGLIVFALNLVAR